MKVLVPIDGSDRSIEALRFAADLISRFEGTLHAVHVTDIEGESTERLLDRAREVLAEEGIDDDPTVTIDMFVDQPRASARIGRDVLEIADDGGYDHIVMGHHGTGRIGRAILGSAAETVVRGSEIPVTIL